MLFPAIQIGLLSVLALTSIGCDRAKSAVTKSDPPAKVTGAKKEDQLTTVELTDEAEKRLGIEIGKIELRTITQQRVYGGEVTLPNGATIIVSAPVAGKLGAPAGGLVPKPGAIVTEKQPVLTLLPLLSPAEKIALATQSAEAAGQIQQAQTQVDANQIALERAERLVKESVGTVRMVDEAKAQLTLSQKALEAATSRKKILDVTQSSGDSAGDQTPFVIDAPQAGMIRAMHVMRDEVVTSGAVLFEVMNMKTVWIRVAVHVSELAHVDPDQVAEVGDLASRPGQTRVKASPIAAPPTATSLSSTVDLYYEVANAQGRFRPGQRVSVELALVGNSEQSAVPWSAVVQDIYGGHWIYEKTAEHKFVRRRVQVKNIVDSWAVLEQSPPVGTTIVTIGVAEIFGTEFWVSK